MEIRIGHWDMDEEIADMFLRDKFVSISIDYMYNAVMGWYNSKEYTVYDFSPIFQLDNRKHTYELYLQNDQILLEFEAKN
jgi:hypothetical protein